jgi:hypothetical protein
LVNLIALQNPGQLSAVTAEEEVEKFLSHHEEELARSAGDGKV